MASRKITTAVFRASFLRLLEPREGDDGRKVYECTMIFDKKEDVANIQQLVDEVIKEKFGDKQPPFFRKPLRPGVQKTDERPNGFDLSKYPEYEGKIIATARAYGEPAPGVVDASCQAIIDPREIYSGIWGRASVTAYWYDNKGGKGVALALQNFQKVRDGEPLGTSRGRAEDDFTVMVDEGANNTANGDLLGDL